MGRITFSASVNWAQYWSLKLMQHELGCSDLEIHACPGSVTISKIDEKKVPGLAFRDVTVERRYQDDSFSVVCHMTRNQDGDWWIARMEYGYTPRKGRGYDRFLMCHDIVTKIPEYPERLDDISFKERVYPA